MLVTPSCSRALIRAVNVEASVMMLFTCRPARLPMASRGCTPPPKAGVRQKLLDAARSLIREKGYSSTSVDELCGQAGDMQVRDAAVGGLFNMGGAAVANYVSILERIR